MMQNYRGKTAHIISICSPGNVPARDILFYFGFFLLALTLLTPGISFANASQIPTPAAQQNSTIRSFHETTELAESLWADLTSRFIIQYEKGDYQNALFIAKQSYNIAHNNFGLYDVNTADALLKLGIINQTLGKLNEAEDHLLGALVILEDQLSPDHPDLAVIMTNLGNTYFELQRNADSEKHHKKALEIRLNAFGESDPSVAQSTYNLAVLYENQKKYNLAADFYREAINIWSASVGPTHPYVGNALNNLSKIYNIQGNHKKATTVLQRTVAFKKSVFGAKHEEVAQTLITLGTSYLEQGKYSPASIAYEEALDIAQHILRSSDPQLALLMYTLANIYHTQARIAEQNPSAKMSTVSHQATNSNNLAGQKSPAADETRIAFFAQALPLYEKAAEILGDGDSGTQSALDVVLSELAMLYKEIGNTDKALATESRIAAH